jgi:hypothetical protein
VVLTAVLAGEDKIEKQNVPEEVIAGFQKLYPFATMRAYFREEKDNIAYYKIGCSIGAVAVAMTFTGDGDLYQVEQPIGAGAVPKAASAGFRKAYPKATAKRTFKLTRGTSTLYEFDIQKGKEEIEVVVDGKGKVLEPEAPGGAGEEKPVQAPDLGE